MLFRRHKEDPLLSRAKASGKDDAVKEEELSDSDKEVVAEAQLVKMGIGEDAEADEIAEKYLKQMGTGEDESKDEDVDDLKDILATPAQSEEEASTASEKVEEKAEDGAENKKPDGLLADIFEQEEEEERSFLAGLVASLPDITAQELFKDVEEVKGLMSEWRQGQ